MSATLLQPQIIPSRSAVVRVWNLSWDVKRMFEIRGVPEMETRGNHAHRTCRQAFYCPSGSFQLQTSCWLADLQAMGTNIHKMRPGMLVEVPEMHWIVLSDFSLDGVATVLCSEIYLEGESITDWKQFLETR